MVDSVQNTGMQNPLLQNQNQQQAQNNPLQANIAAFQQASSEFQGNTFQAFMPLLNQNGGGSDIQQFMNSLMSVIKDMISNLQGNTVASVAANASGTIDTSGTDDAGGTADASGTDDATVDETIDPESYQAGLNALNSMLLNIATGPGIDLSAGDDSGFSVFNNEYENLDDDLDY